MSTGRQGGVGKIGLGIAQLRRQVYYPLIISGIVGGWVELVRDAIEQAYPRPRFQLLGQLDDVGAAYMQYLHRLGEAAGFCHTGKGLHRTETVHWGSGPSGTARILQTVTARVARLSMTRVALLSFRQQ